MFTLELQRSTTIETAAARLGGRQVQVWRDQADAACAIGHAGDGWWAMEWPGWAIFRFGHALGDTVQVMHRPDVPAERLTDTYRRSVLPLQLQALGREALHASANAVGDGVIALCGERWAGKSTFAYGLHRRGFLQRSDDSLVLDVTTDAVLSVPLPFTPRLRPASQDYFEIWESPAWHTAARAEHVRAVFILQPDAGASPCHIAPLSGGDAFRALLAHAHVFDPGSDAARRRLVQQYLEVAAQVPLYRLRYAPRIDDLPRVLDRLLAALGVPDPVAP